MGTEGVVSNCTRVLPPRALSIGPRNQGVYMYPYWLVLHVEGTAQ